MTTMIAADAAIIRRRRSMLFFLLAIAAASSLLFFTSKLEIKHSIQENPNLNHRHPRRLSIFGPAPASTNNLLLARYADPKSVSLRSDGNQNKQHAITLQPQRRTNCQIIYVLGVEGSIHHGFMPIIKTLAEQQIDPATGTAFNVVKGHEALRATIFGSNDREAADVPLNDPNLVQSTLEEICPHPNEVWKRHVIIEGNSFPSGSADNVKLQFRVRRQPSWIDMTPQQISEDVMALNHPTNLYEFYDAFSPYVDVRFIVLHRPYLDTIASHIGFDTGAEKHSNVISGFMILLSKFLMRHLYSSADGAAMGGGKNGNVPLWTIVCAGSLSSKQYETDQQLFEARQNVLTYLANFLDWPQRNCPTCFDKWRESTKSASEGRLGKDMTGVILDHMKQLEGIWPPRREEDSLPEQLCRM